MDEILKTSLLFDFYSGLLTEKQCKVYEMYFHDDLTLQEIAEVLGISKQAVSDLIRRTQANLLSLEKNLGLVEKYGFLKQKINELFFQIEEFGICETSNTKKTANIQKLKNEILELL